MKRVNNTKPSIQQLRLVGVITAPEVSGPFRPSPTRGSKIPSNNGKLRRLSITAAIVCGSLWCSDRVQGEVIISIQAKTFAPQTNDSFDVMIMSNVDQFLKLASFKIAIAPQMGNTASLFFRDTFSSADPLNLNNQSKSEQSEPSYIFASSLDPDPAVFSSIRQPGDLEIIGADASLLASGVTMIANQSYLLTRLEVFTQNPGNGTFGINLVKDPGQTLFLDNNDAEIDINANSFDSVTFQITAVPEPSSAILAIGAAVTAFFARYRTKRQALGTSAT